MGGDRRKRGGKIWEGEGELLWRSNVLHSLEIKSNGHLSYLVHHSLGPGDWLSTFLLLASEGY